MLGLLRAISRPVPHIGIGSKSNWNRPVDSTEGGRGRRPRPTTIRRLKRALFAATYKILASPAGGRPRALRPEPPGAAARKFRLNFRAEGALSSACHVTDYSPLILECPAAIDFAGAPRGEIWTCYRHRIRLKIKLEPLGGWYYRSYPHVRR